MEANTNSAHGHHPNTTSNGLLTGLLMSTNKASCRNPTSPLWHLELLSNHVFSHTFRPWEFAFPPSRHEYRETVRVKDGELGRSERVKYELQFLQQDLHHEDSLHGAAIFTRAQIGRSRPRSAPVLGSKLLSVPYLRHPPYTQFASRFGFTPLILSWKLGEEMVQGDLWEVEEVGKWVRGLRPKRTQLPLQHLGLPPQCSTSPLPPFWGVEVTVCVGLCCTSQTLHAKKFLRIGIVLWRALGRWSELAF